METTDRKRKQEEFWMALIDKYEKRNAALEQQGRVLQSQFHQTSPASRKNELKESSSTCSCSPCLTKKTAYGNGGSSVFSLASDDLQYMLQVKELVDREKEMQRKIKQHQEGGLLRNKNMDEEEAFKECKCENASDLSNSLLEENKRLTDELQDLKLEMKQCIEKIEGPITRQVEKEKNRNKSLETEVLKMTKHAASLQQTLTEETDGLKFQLNDRSRELSSVAAVNNKLQNGILSQKTRCTELEEALIDQKLAEAEILMQFKNGRNNQSCQPCPCGVSQPPYSPSPQHIQSSCICQCPLVRMLISQEAAGDKDDTLLAIGKRLNAALKDAEQCPCCQNYIPQDLKDTCKGIKEILALVGNKGLNVPEPALKEPHEDLSGKKPSISDKSKETDKTLEMISCVCQTDEKGTKTSEAQVQPHMSENETRIDTDKTDIATVTEEDAAEETTATETPDTREATAEIVKDTTDSEAETTPETKEIIAEAGVDTDEPVTETPAVKVQSTVVTAANVQSGTDVQMKSEVSIDIKTSAVNVESKVDIQVKSEENVGEKKLASSAICSALRSQLEKTCKAICSKSSAVEKESKLDTEGEIITEIELHGDGLYTEIGAEILVGEGADGTQITTTITGSGTLEVITEGPAGIIETTMTYTDSGNVEILTEITEYEGEVGLGAPALAVEGEDTTQAVQFQESGISQGTASSTYAAESAYSADVSMISSKITDGTFQPQRTEVEIFNQPSLQHQQQQEEQKQQLGQYDIAMEEQLEDAAFYKTTGRSGEPQADEYEEKYLLVKETTSVEADKTEQFKTDTGDLSVKIRSDESEFTLDHRATGERNKNVLEVEGEGTDERLEGTTDKAKHAVSGFCEDNELLFEKEKDDTVSGYCEENKLLYEEKKEDTVSGFCEETELIRGKEKDDTVSGFCEENELVYEKEKEYNAEREDDKYIEEQETRKEAESDKENIIIGLQEQEDKSDKVAQFETSDKMSLQGVVIVTLKEEDEEEGEELTTRGVIITLEEHEGGSRRIECQEPAEDETPSEGLSEATLQNFDNIDLPTISTSSAKIAEAFGSAVELLSVLKENIQDDEAPLIDADLKDLQEETVEQPWQQEKLTDRELSSMKSDSFLSAPPLSEELHATTQKPEIITLSSTETPLELLDATSTVATKTSSMNGMKTHSVELKTDQLLLKESDKEKESDAAPCDASTSFKMSSAPETSSGDLDKSFDYAIGSAAVADPAIAQRQRIVTEQIGLAIDTESLKKDVAEALMRANKNVLDALDDANKHVMGALETANRDVNSALAALEDLNATSTRISEESVSEGALEMEFAQTNPFASDYSSEKPCSFQPSDKDQYIHQQKQMQDKMLSELEAAKRAAVECKMICFEFMQEQFKLLAKNTVEAKTPESQIKTTKPYDVTADENDCKRACEELIKQLQAPKPHVVRTEENDCRKACEELIKQIQGAKPHVVRTDEIDCRNACEELIRQMQTTKPRVVRTYENDCKTACEELLKQMQATKPQVVRTDESDCKKVCQELIKQMQAKESYVVTTDENDCRRACEELIKQMHARDYHSVVTTNDYDCKKACEGLIKQMQASVERHVVTTDENDCKKACEELLKQMQATQPQVVRTDESDCKKACEELIKQMQATKPQVVRTDESDCKRTCEELIKQMQAITKGDETKKKTEQENITEITETTAVSTSEKQEDTSSILPQSMSASTSINKEDEEKPKTEKDLAVLLRREAEEDENAKTQQLQHDDNGKKDAECFVNPEVTECLDTSKEQDVLEEAIDISEELDVLEAIHLDITTSGDDAAIFVKHIEDEYQDAQEVFTSSYTHEEEHVDSDEVLTKLYTEREHTDVERDGTDQFSKMEGKEADISISQHDEKSYSTVSEVLEEVEEFVPSFDEINEQMTKDVESDDFAKTIKSLEEEEEESTFSMSRSTGDIGEVAHKQRRSSEDSGIESKPSRKGITDSKSSSDESTRKQKSLDESTRRGSKDIESQLQEERISQEKTHKTGSIDADILLEEEHAGKRIQSMRSEGSLSQGDEKSDSKLSKVLEKIEEFIPRSDEINEQITKDLESDDFAKTNQSSEENEGTSSMYRSTGDDIDEVARKQRRKSSEERRIESKPSRKGSTDSKSGSDEGTRKRKSIDKSTRRGSKDIESKLQERRLSQEKTLKRASTDADILLEEEQARKRSHSVHGQGTGKTEQPRPCSADAQLMPRERWPNIQPICDCPGDCECEICAPEKMTQRIKRQRGKQDDCTCLPDCQCAVCNAYDVEKRKLLPCGDQEDKEVQKGSTAIPNIFGQKPIASQLNEMCHPLDCTCVSCLCDPCKPKMLSKSRNLCHAKNCRCDECLCNCNLTDTSLHPPECYCLECLCEICPSLRKYETLAKCEASCFDTKIDIDSEIGIKTQQLVTKGEELLDGKLKDINEETDTDKGTKETEKPLIADVISPKAENKEEKEGYRMDDKIHPEDCTCPLCQCPGADLVTVHKKPHGIDCDCPECRCESCPGIEVQTSEAKPDTTSKSVARDEENEITTPEQPQSQYLEVMTDALLQQKLLEMEDENNQRKQEMKDLKDLLDQIRCACASVDSNVPRLQPQKIALETTMSGLQTTLANLQEKCKAKDQMIEALTQELRLRASSKVFNDMLKNISTGRPTNVDYDRMEVCAMLPRPKESFTYGRPSHRLQKCEHPDFPNCLCVTSAPERHQYQNNIINEDKNCTCEGGTEKDEHPAPLMQNDNPECSCSICQENVKPLPRPEQNPAVSSDEEKCLCEDAVVVKDHKTPTGDSADRKMPQNTCLCPEGGIHVDPEPLEIIEARKVSPDSLLLKWVPPRSNLVTGYEIDVDGVLKSRVHSTERTSAIVHGLMFTADITINLFAVSKNGRCLPPTHKIIQAHSCS